MQSWTQIVNQLKNVHDFLDYFILKFMFKLQTNYHLRHYSDTSIFLQQTHYLCSSLQIICNLKDYIEIQSWKISSIWLYCLRLANDPQDWPNPLRFILFKNSSEYRISGHASSIIAHKHESHSLWTARSLSKSHQCFTPYNPKITTNNLFYIRATPNHNHVRFITHF